MAVNASTLRLTGLSSGMDTDSIIKNLMKIEQLKLDRQLHERTKLQWKQEALEGVKSDLTSFKQSFLSVLSANSIAKADTYNTYKIDVTGANASAVTLSAGLDASTGSITVNEITQLAKGASSVSSGKVSNNDEGLSATNSTQLKDLKFQTALTFDNNQISFEINGETFTFNDTDTLAKVLSTVNSNANAKVTMSYSRLTDVFTIESKTTGVDSSLTIKNLTGNAFAAGGAFGITGDGSELKNGQDAKLKINNIDVSRASNSFAIDGITYKLNNTTDSAINAVVSRDVQPAVDKIKAFVEGYNKLVKGLDDKLIEKKTTSEAEYTPLTDAEKSELGLSDEQIEEWEAIAKKGLLRNDSGIQTMLRSLRTALFDRVADAGLSPSDIGLTTGAYSLGTKGQISLDEDTLRAALEADPDRVMNVFTHVSESTDASVKYRESGLAERIGSIIDRYTGSYQSVSLTNLSNSLTSINDRISQLETKMLAKEEQYYKKFAAMETALSSLTSQSEWLSSVLSTNQ
ncbi:MAG: flagellar filament capping protein FliD [Oscillospiraceae bacterium]|jgi:flagellar hook-associated protein 2|nr:flagellar filament capping protein FliD [Oscillospiraceae bacterium]